MARVRNRGYSGCGCGPIIGLMLLLVAYALFFEKPDEPTNPGSLVAVKAMTTPTLPPSPAPSSCKLDWRLCKDNADLANNNDDSSKASFLCKYAANDRAKYGDPKWGWFPFSSFRRGEDAPQTGIEIKVDKEVQFQNGFGAWAHVRAVCLYDLKKKEVISVEIEDR